MSTPGDYYYPASSHSSSRSTRRSPNSNTHATPDAYDASYTSPGQSGRTVLPPIRSYLSSSPSSASPSSAPSNHAATYAHDRAHPQGSYEYSSSAYGGDWTNSGMAHSAQAASFDPQARYQGQYYPSHPSRASSGLPGDVYPISAQNPAGRDDRYLAGYSSTSPAAGAAGLSGHYDMHSSTGNYATSTPYGYQGYQATSYSYPHAGGDMRSSQVPYLDTSAHTVPARSVTLAARTRSSRPAAHSVSPYARRATASSSSLYGAPGHAHHGHAAEPHSPEDEPIVKKKRKRADAAQLKVLNETYNRTPFPSTEERQDLARRLDMSARSVQIWFQNKRQSMRQGGRNSTAGVVSTAATVGSAASAGIPTSQSRATMLQATAASASHASIPRASYSTPPMGSIVPPSVPYHPNMRTSHSPSTTYQSPSPSGVPSARRHG